MTMKKILVALDSSPIAPKVLAEAALFAQSFGAELILLRAVGLPTELPPEAFAMAPDNVTTLLFEAAEKDLATLASALPAELKTRRVVRVGTAWRVVCDVADEESADLILIGAHGHRFIDRVLGTTTQRVVSHTERSVYIARPKA
jgi:nucleotide-binding universal stress UspA family protein